MKLWQRVNHIIKEFIAPFLLSGVAHDIKILQVNPALEMVDALFQGVEIDEVHCQVKLVQELAGALSERRDKMWIEFRQALSLNCSLVLPEQIFTSVPSIPIL